METNPAPGALAKTFGAALLGTFVGAMLYGCICILVYRYFREYRKDRRWFKGMVFFLWLVDSAHTAFSMHYCYYYLVSRAQNPEVRAFAVWSLLTANLLTIFPPFISNMFYLSRLWKIGQRNLFIIGGIFFLIIARLALETANQVVGYIHPNFDDFTRFHYYVKAYCSVSSVVDSLLAVFMISRLRFASRKVSRAAKTVDLIIVYLLGTGALTGLVCTLSLFAAIFLTGGLVDVTLHAILGKLYIISVLAVLNSRNSHIEASDIRRYEFYQVSTFGVDETTQCDKAGLMETISSLNSGVEFKQGKEYRGPVSSATYRFEDEPPMSPVTPDAPATPPRAASPPRYGSPGPYQPAQVGQKSDVDITLQSPRARSLLTSIPGRVDGRSPGAYNSLTV